MKADRLLNHHRIHLRVLAFVLTLCCSLVVQASDFYYYYNNYVSSYPTGKGLVYATENANETVAEEQFTGDVLVEYCHSDDDKDYYNPCLYLYNKPAEGYGFNGWYWYDIENDSPGDFITRYNVIESDKLRSAVKDYYGEEIFDEAPENDIAGVFGRVNCMMKVDNLEELKERDVLYERLLSSAEHYFGPLIDNPANEIGDEITLETDTLYESEVRLQGNDDEETEVCVVAKCVFKNWTDSKGNMYIDPLLHMTVKEKETFTAHYEYQVCDPMLLYEDGELFTALTQEGVEMTFKVLSVKEKTCQVGGSAASLFEDGIPAISNKTKGAVTIPPEAKGFSVVSIEDDAFPACDSITQIFIPNSIGYIAPLAFWGCSSLETIIVDKDNPVYDSRENSNAVIYTATDSLIVGCNKTVIPNTIRRVNGKAFYGTGIEELHIPKNVENIRGFEVFGKNLSDRIILNCPNLCRITVDRDNPVYDSRDDCNAIIETATNALIAGCRETLIPQTVTSIGSYALCYYCPDEVVVPFAIDSIGYDAFFSSTLKKIIISEGVNKICNAAFYECRHLTSVIIPESVTSIGAYAFEDCDSLTTVIVKRKMPIEIDSNVFLGCENATLYVPSGCVPSYKDTWAWSKFKEIKEIGELKPEIDGIYYRLDMEKMIAEVISRQDNTKYRGEIVIPSSIVYSGETYSVTGIDDYAFYECKGLTSVILPNSVTNIGSFAFYGCTGLLSVTMPYGLTSIGGFAFEECKALESVIIPGSVAWIGSGAFRSCTSLTSVTVGRKMPVDIDSNYTFSNRGNATLYVPSGCSSAYYAAPYWNEFREIIEIKESIPEVDGIYYRLDKEQMIAEVTSKQDNTKYRGEIVIPSSIVYSGETYSVTGIDDSAFKDCEALTSISIPNSIAVIGGSAFDGCRLRNVFVKCDTPPVFDGGKVFSQQTLYHAMLYIPAGSWETYVYDDVWYQFINIRETAIKENQLSAEQAYTLMDANTFAYSVYDPVNNCIGTVSFAGGIDESNPNHSWQLVEADGSRYLYNIGAKKFVKKSASGDSLELSSLPEPIGIADGKDGIILDNQTDYQWALVCNDRLCIDQAAAEDVTGLMSQPSTQQTNRSIYNLSGQQIAVPQRGLNIIRRSDGTTKRVMVK